MDINGFFDELNKNAGITSKKKIVKNMTPKVVSQKENKPKTTTKKVVKEKQHKQTTDMNESIVEKSLTYTSVILKSIRETFEGDEKRIVYESLYNSLGQLLGDNKPIVIEKQEMVKPIQNIKEESKIEPQINEGYSRTMGITITEDGADLSNVSQSDISDFKELAGM
jgi:hypothetical protein